MELGKVPSSTEKEKDRKKPKEDNGDMFGRDKKERKKKPARKDGGDGLGLDRRKAASAVFPAGAPYLIRAAWDVKGREDETGLASESKAASTQFFKKALKKWLRIPEEKVIQWPLLKYPWRSLSQFLTSGLTWEKKAKKAS